MGPALARFRPSAAPCLGVSLTHLRGTIRVRERARDLYQERPQVNRLADQLAVSPSVRVEGLLMIHSASLFHPSAAALRRPSRRNAE